MQKVKYTTVSIKEILAQPTLRLDPGYWIKKKGTSPKLQAPSYKPQRTSLTREQGYYRMEKTNKGEICKKQ